MSWKISTQPDEQQSEGPAYVQKFGPKKRIQSSSGTSVGGGGSVIGKEELDDARSYVSATTVGFVRTHINYRLSERDGEEYREALKACREFEEEYTRLAAAEIGEQTVRDERYQIALTQRKTELDHQITHAETILNLKDHCYIPEYANRLEETRFQLEPNYGYFNGSTRPQFEPISFVSSFGSSFDESALTAFGSHKNYAQGINIEYSAERRGKLDNAYVVEMSISEIVNNTGYAVGITLCHGNFEALSNGLSGPDDPALVPFTDTQEYSPYTGKRYHYIARPGQRDASTVVFRSDENINAEYSRNYPDITSAEADLTKGRIDYGSKFAFPVNSPIIAHVIRTLPLHPNWEKPTRIESESKELNGLYSVKKEMCKLALQEIQEIIDQTLPITDLRTIHMKAEPTKINEAWEEEKSLHSDFEKDKQYKLAEQVSQVTSYKERGIMPFSCKVKVVYLFRSQEDDTLYEVEEEGEVEFASQAVTHIARSDV